MAPEVSYGNDGASVNFNQCAHINTFKFIGIKVLGQSTAHIRLFDVYVVRPPTSRIYGETLLIRSLTMRSV